MEPISSLVSSRASASQPPVPAQQKQNEEALTAPQTRTDSYSTSVPGQDVQLQRRQVVDDIGRNQKLTDQLSSASSTLESARNVADQASDSDIDDESREALGQQFAETRSQLNRQADQLERSGGNAAGLRIESGIASADEAKSTSQTLSTSLDQVNSQLAALSRQGQSLGQDFPRSAQNNNVEPAVRNSQQANDLSNQLQRQLRSQPDSAINGQANVSRQTALTLFQ